MKRLLFISAIATIALAACSKDKFNLTSNETNVPADTGKGYIHFDTGISTRGALVTDQYLQADFAVYGYYYASTWAASYMMAKPNVFDQWPEIVSYADGIYTYTDPVQWKGYNYSFYAYYPAENDNITAHIVQSTEGEPYITYTIPSTANPEDYVDLMTASFIDTNANASKTVQFEFHHRLSAIDAGARCFYDYTYEDESGVTQSIPAIIEIEQLWLTFTNLQNASAKIFLNKDKGAEYTEATQANQERLIQLLTANTLHYGIEGNDNKDIAPNKDGDTSIRLLTEGEKTMIVLPQTNLLSAKPSLQYYIRIPDDDSVPEDMRNKYLAGDKTSLQDTPQQFTYSTDFTFDRPLLEGRRYFIQFNFTSDAVSVNIVAADEWDEVDKIDYEFE